MQGSTRMSIKRPSRFHALRLALALAVASWSWPAVAQRPKIAASLPLTHKVQAATERLEMTVNSSRILSLDLRIPRAVVNNRDLLDLTPLSPKEFQIFARKTGVTQVNLWDEKGQIHAI